MSLPPVLSTIAFENAAAKNPPNIPYSISTSSGDLQYGVIVLADKDADTLEDVEASDTLKESAVDKIIEHYFPEFYPLLMEGKIAILQRIVDESAPFNSAYQNLRNEVSSGLSIARFDKPYVIFSTDVDLREIRDRLEENDNLPEFSNALETFNFERGVSEEVDSTSFKFQNTPRATSDLANILTNLGKVAGQFPGLINIPADFNSMQTGVTQIINRLLQGVYDSVDFGTQEIPFTPYDTDYITIYFDESSNITRIEYFVLNVERSEDQQSKIGFITNQKYNLLFQDPMNLKLLQNYEQILRNSEQRSGLSQQSSIIDFMSTLGLGTGADLSVPYIADTPGSMTPGNNIFGRRDSDDYIDVSDFDQLENTFSTCLTAEELIELEQSANDPALRRKILQKEKAKKVNANIQVVKIIDDVLNFNIPLAGPNKTKEQRAINALLSQFGIQQMAKEAVICFTLGMGATASRITQAVRNSIIKSASSLRQPPTRPSEETNIQRPTLGQKLKDPTAYFSVTGSPPIGQKIADIILGALANAAFEVVKSLAELIKFNCDTILRGLTGQIDVGAELQRQNDRAAIDFPNLEDLLEAEFAKYGLSPEKGYQYFSDVSQILDPLEVCRLLNSPLEVEDRTIENILRFNFSYPLPAIRNNVTTRNAVMSYFQNISSHVDTISICNDIINNIVVTTVEGCNICLDDDLPGNPALSDLISIAENGITLAAPVIDFLCPESQNYLENPVATRVLPSLFGNIINTTKIYMAGSLEAARTSLLEPTISTSPDPDLINGINALGLGLPTASFDPGVLDFVTDMFDAFENISGELIAGAQTCQDIETTKMQDILENIEIVVEAITAGLNEVPGVIEEVNNKVSSLQAQADLSSSAVPHTTYVFPEAFRHAFQTAIGALTFTSPTAEHHDTTGLASTDDAMNSSYVRFDAGTGVFETAALHFNFPSILPNSPVNKVSLRYAPFEEDEQDSFFSVVYNLPYLDIGSTEISNFLDQEYDQLPLDNSYEDTLLNPYIFRFSNPVVQHTSASFGSTHQVVGEKYMEAYTGLYSSMFKYIVNNGAFNQAKVNNLNFFKNNENCEPANIGDLFDADGILDQMRKEFAASACEDPGTNKEKVRNVLYFGLLNMLIQTIIDEFIVKNIIVFTAFRMDDILNPTYPFKDFMVQQVVKVFDQIRLDGNSILETELFNYFTRVTQRASTAAKGGLTHSYAPNDVVPGFETPDFTSPNPLPAFPQHSFTPLIQFMVEERLGYTWMDGSTERSTLQTINKILDPDNTVKNYEDVFLEDVIGIYDAVLDSEFAPFIAASRSSLQDFIDFAALAEITLEEAIILGAQQQPSFDASAATLYILDDTEAEELTLYVGYLDMTENTIHRAPLINFPYALGTFTLEQKRALVKSSEEYQIFFNQTFSKNGVLMVPVLYNFYLTERYFSDISDAFRNTKRAIINFMDMTEASSRPPAPPVMNNEFVNTLANNGEQDLGSLAREIFLKFLKETPIQILKGLVELIDPHVAISKLIRDITGDAFVEVGKALTTAINSGPAPNPLKDAGVTGDDLLAMMFCIYTIGNAAGSNALTESGAADLASPEAPLFGPRITLDGVDFKGTITGMFMLPPSPLGILYLLLEMLKLKIDEDLNTEPTTEDATANPPSNEC